MSGWSEQDVLDHEQRRAFAQSLSDSISPLAIVERLASIPGAVERFNALSGEETRALAYNARGRVRTPKGMNKTETRYALHLELQKRSGDVLWYKFEGVTFKLADDTRYTPDFAVMQKDMGEMEFHEVKGPARARKGKKAKGAHCEDDARVKIACAAEQFPFRFLMVWPKENGEWDSKEF